ncbi:RidA family protein [Haladaptatus sp. NG-WS-4]
MKKTVLAPEYADIDSDELDTTASSLGVVTHREGYRKVVLSGALWPEGGLEDQTRTVLEYVREVVCDDLGGSMDDVTSLRFFVRDDVLTPENRTLIHEVRSALFELPHYPASTMVGVASLVDGAVVEIEVEAEIPDDEWETETLTESDT